MSASATAHTHVDAYAYASISQSNLISDNLTAEEKAKAYAAAIRDTNLAQAIVAALQGVGYIRPLIDGLAVPSAVPAGESHAHRECKGIGRGSNLCGCGIHDRWLVTLFVDIA